MVAMVLLPLSMSVGDAWASLMVDDEFGGISRNSIDGLVTTLAIIGITAMRNIPLAFPSDNDSRSAMIDGLSGEIIESVNIDRRAVVVFLTRAFDAVKGTDAAACSAPLATGAFRTKKRPLGGVGGGR